MRKIILIAVVASAVLAANNDDAMRAYSAANYQVAGQIWTDMCAQGDGQACANLGVLYHKGLGVQTSIDAAREVYERGCDAGFGGACDNLGSLYEEQGMLQSALAQYERGCDAGLDKSCMNVERLYLAHADENDDAAFEGIYSAAVRSCELGNRASCGDVAEFGEILGADAGELEAKKEEKSWLGLGTNMNTNMNLNLMLSM